MRVLLLGVGMQGKAALHDLVQSADVESIVAADYDADALTAYVNARGYGDRVQTKHVDAARTESLVGLMSGGHDVVIDLMPVTFHDRVATLAVDQGLHVVNASYATPEMYQLAARAQAKGLTILPEFGMDPGIDLVLLGEAVRSFDHVDAVITYGAGFPEPSAADNPLRYKVTWTFEGLLRSYYRAARVIRNGQVVDVHETEMFNPQHTHELEIDGLGTLEAFPNGDALRYADLLDIAPSQLESLGRYVLRWPGHCALWKTLVDLHFLDPEPLVVDGMTIGRRRFLAALIEPQIQYGDEERDIVVVKVDVTGRKGTQKKRVSHQIVDYRDLQTGFTSMSRTVGYTASIGAQMVVSQQITKRGLASPLKDVPFDLFVGALGKRGIKVNSEVCNA